MKAIERAASRPMAVQKAIDELMRLAVEIESQGARLTQIALGLRELGADTDPIADASHDLDHAWKHLTSVRRALVMAWPTEDGA